MTLSLYSTYKAWRRDVAAEKAAEGRNNAHPIHSGIGHALALLGLGIEGMSCGGDVSPPGKH